MPDILLTREVPSQSDPRKTYTVTVYETYTHCTCPAWKNSKLPSATRVCKHIERVTGEARKGDAQLTGEELGWVIEKLLDTTDKSFRSIAAAVLSELASNNGLDTYQRRLAGNVVLTLQRIMRYENEPPGPDARAALMLILKALEGETTVPA